MTSETALWTATASAAALFGLLSTAAMVLKSDRSRLWAGFMLLVLLRILLAHALPHLETALLYAKTLARLFSGSATILFAWGASLAAGYGPGRKALAFAAAAGLATGAFSLAGMNPGLAVLPLEWTAAAFCLYALTGGRPRHGLMKTALILLFLRSATHPFAYGLKLSEDILLAFSLLFWLIPSSAALASLVQNMRNGGDDRLPGGERKTRFETAENFPVILAEAGTGAIIDANSQARSFFGLAEGDLSHGDLWELAAQGRGSALREKLLTPGGEPFLADVARGDGREGTVLVALLEEEKAGRLVWRIKMSPVGESLRAAAPSAASRTSSYAHDLKNLLHTITASSDRLKTRLGNEDKGLKSIADAVKQSDGLIMRLLDASSAPRKETTVEPGALAAELENLVAPTLPSGAVFRTAAARGSFRLAGDAAELTRAAINLLVNARESIGAGGGTIALSIASEGNFLTITVEDDGPGVPEGDRARIFEQGYSGKGVNRGKGLAIVREAAENLGGTVACGKSSRLGGAFFKIAVPLLGGNDTPGERIVVADADGASRAEVCRALKMAGHHVSSSPSGTRALELLAGEERKTGVLVTDLIVEGIGGRALIEEARRRLPGLTIIVTGSMADEEVKNGALGAGADFFLAKPLSGEAIARAISCRVTSKGF